MNIYWMCVLCWALCWSLAHEGERERWHFWPHTIHRHLRWYWKGSGIQKNTKAIGNDLTGLEQQGWKRETQNSMQTAQRAKEPPSGFSNDFSFFAHRAEEGCREGSPQERMAKAEWGILKDGDKLSGPSAGDQFVMTQIRVTLAI